MKHFTISCIAVLIAFAAGLGTGRSVHERLDEDELAKARAAQKAAEARTQRLERLLSFPDLAGETEWGRFSQNVSRLTFAGENWLGVGAIHPDGAQFWVHMAWANSQGKRAAGVYKVTGSTLEGSWGWERDVKIEGHVMSGAINPETIEIEWPGTAMQAIRLAASQER